MVAKNAAYQNHAMRWAMKLPRATPRALQDYRRGMIMRAIPLSSVLLQAAVVLVFCGSSTATNIRYTNSWAVEVRNGGSKAADALARKYGFENRGQVGSLESIYHFVLPMRNYTARKKRIGDSFNQVTRMVLNERNVGFVEQQVVRKKAKKSYSPPTDPSWRNQWPLLNSGQLGLPDIGHDLNVEPVWIQGITGCNSFVAVVDDGVEYTHPDLQTNYVRSLGYDYVDDDSNPFPVELSGQREDHGTSCAGEIAMVKNNGVCGVGVAYQSSITGIRVLGDSQTDLQEARALSHRDDIISIYSNSWGPFDFGFTVEGPGPLVQRTFQIGTAEGRGGKGSIYVWAAGNGGRDDSCAADGYASSIYTIAMGAASSNGSQASYDEDCAGKMAVTFVSNSLNDTHHITTTIAHGRCTNGFEGTSAATPLAAGVIALMLEANTTLTWRDVQYLIVYTSNPSVLSGGDWVTNGAGLNVSHQFGFGALDTEALVTRARQWITVPEQQMNTVTPSQTNGTNVGAGSSLNITFSYNNNIQFLEHVVVTMSLGFEGARDYTSDPYFYYYLLYNFDYYESEVEPNRGDIQVELLSPSGTRSIILPYRKLDTFPGSFTNWPFMSVHYWGEDPRGQWMLTVRFRGSTSSAVVSNLTVTFYGTAETPAAVQRIPTHCDPACLRGCAAAGTEFCDACVNLRNAHTLECINQCPPRYVERNGYCYDPTVPEAQCIRRPVVPPSVPTSSALSLVSSLRILALLSSSVPLIILVR